MEYNKYRKTGLNLLPAHENSILRRKCSDVDNTRDGIGLFIDNLLNILNYPGRFASSCSFIVNTFE